MPVGTPSGRPTQIAASQQVGANEHDQLTLVEIVLWLQLLALVAGVIGWLAAKWGRMQLWLAAVPVLLAVIWGLSNTAITLMSNVL
jgi:cation transporter-like permease